MKYAQVIFMQKTGEDLDSSLTYQIPEDISVQKGQKISAPIRRQKKPGIIWQIHDQKPDFRTLKITPPEKDQPLLGELQLQLINWMSQYYFCPIFQILKLFLPAKILNDKAVKPRKKDEEQIIRSKPKTLTQSQENCIKKILNSGKQGFLIHGITGSGKTEIYTHLTNHYLEKGQQVLFLVPEISLTPQMIDYFQKSTGQRPAVIHSKLSEGQRHQAWLDIHSGKAKLIIGSRSAIFSPFNNIGAIIIDEEHENSYKQDSSPRYHTLKIAEKMTELLPDLKLILGSATPNVQTAHRYKDTTITLTERIGESQLPDIEIVDLREEFQKKNYSIFSDRLHQEITNSLKNNQQIILFLNRRGQASSIVCRDCGYTQICKSCETPLTYHTKTLNLPSLICHHCGDISKPQETCPNCNGTNIRFLGIGTQRIEAECLKEFPEAKILRADKDTTSKKDSFKQIYQSFKNKEADILIGTQMIAKGLHLPNVNLVGVILADIGMNIPDYATAERNFQLLTQVSGRSGRGQEKGKVIIQTYNPENITLKHTQDHSYADFYEHEIKQRNFHKNPPFGRLVKILIEDPNYQKCQNLSEEFENKIWLQARKDDLAQDLEINRYPAFIPRLRNKYRFIVLVNYKQQNENLHKLLEKLPKEYIMNPNIKIDIDPTSTT